MITPEKLQKIIGKNDVEFFTPFCDALNNFMPRYKINSPLRVAHFISQCAHETAGLTRLTENLNYSAEGLAKTWPSRFADTNKNPNLLAKEFANKPEKIANFVYANRYGNRNFESGDGWKYRGRGLLQITFADNYLYAQNETRRPLLSHPAILATDIECAAHVASSYFTRALVEADTEDVAAVTKKVNGGLNGFADRERYFLNAKKVLLGE